MIRSQLTNGITSRSRNGGYTVQFEDHNRTPPNYCGPAGDFRNESVVSGLVDTPGFDKIRSLDAEAARWLAERNLTHG